MADKYWPNQNPVGERITIDKYLGPDFAAPAREIVGVVGDVRDIAMNQSPEPIVYIPQAHVPNGMTRIDIGVLPVTWAVRTEVEPYSLSSAIERELRQASAGLPVARIRSMQEVIGRSTARSDFTAVLLTIFAGASLLLAANRRVWAHCFLGAAAAAGDRDSNGVGRDAGRGAEDDRLAGDAADDSRGGGRIDRRHWTRALYESLIYGVKPIDPVVMLVACVALCVVAGLAAYVPANRASRLDATGVLKSE